MLRGEIRLVDLDPVRGSPFQTLLTAAATGLRRDSKAQAEQVRSIAVERLGTVLGKSPPGPWHSSTTHCDCTYSCNSAQTRPAPIE